MSEACTTRSEAVGIPSARSFPPRFGISRSRTGSGANSPVFTCWRTRVRKARSTGVNDPQLVGRDRIVGVHRRLLAFQSHVAQSAGSLRHVAGFPDLGLLRTLRPISASSVDGGPARRPGRAGPSGVGDPETVPTFTCDPVGRIGTRLFPCSLATSRPQPFLVASPPATQPGFGVTAAPERDGVRCCPAPIHQV